MLVRESAVDSGIGLTTVMIFFTISSATYFVFSIKLGDLDAHNY